MGWLNPGTWSLWWVGVAFVATTAVIAVVGTLQARTADRLADVTGLGEAIFGAVLLGATTSLPGIVTSVSTAWPDQADGAGTLIVSATDPAGSTVTRTTVSSVDFTEPAATYPAFLSCVPAGLVEVRAFLDDNDNAAGNAITSADYLDSCMAAPRKKEVTVVAGETLPVEVELANSCD